MARFIGRDGELDALLACARLSRGERRVAAAVLVGAPGSGKSRLIAEALERAPFEYRVVVAGFEPEAGVPFSAGWGVLRGLEATSPAAAAGLSSVLSSVATAGPESWMSVLEAAHRARPRDLLLALDDVQWWDERSIALVHYLIRGAVADGDSLMVVLSGRPSGALESLAEYLEPLLEGSPVRIELGPLDDADATAMVRELDPTLDDAAAAELARRAAGSPFWCELLAAAPDPGRDLERIVSSRLLGAEPDTVALVTTLALLGDPSDAVDLASLHRWRPDRVRAAVGDLERRGLVMRDGQTVRVAHDLWRPAIAAHAGASGVRRAHRLVASWLEREAQDDVPRLLSALEHRSAAGLECRRLVRSILESPRRRLAGPEGLRTLARVVEDEGAGANPDPELAAGVAALAAELGQHGAAFERWSALAAELADPAMRARAWIAAANAAVHLQDAGRARACVERARAIDAHDPLVEVEADLVEAGLMRWGELRPEDSRRLTERALTAVRRYGRDESDGRRRRAHLEALALACLDAQQRSAVEELLALTEELTSLAAGVDAAAQVQALVRTGSALLLAGRVEEATTQLDEAWRAAARHVLPGLQLDAGSWLVWSLNLAGRFADVESVAAEGERLAARLGDQTRPAVLVRLHHAGSTISRGEVAAGLAALRWMADEETDAHHRIGLNQAVALHLARLEGARARAEVEARLDTARADAEVAGCVRCARELRFVGTDALVRVEARDDAARWLASTEGEADDGTLLGWHLVRARASMAMGAATNEAAELLEHAAALADERGLAVDGLWVRIDLGRILAGRDADRARRVLEVARERAGDLGATTEQSVAERELRALGVRTWRPTRRREQGTGLAALTPRELAVAELVAQGATNVQIAEALFLSRKTIERHVSAVLAKLEVRNRTELAARLAGRPGVGQG